MVETKMFSTCIDEAVARLAMLACMFFTCPPLLQLRDEGAMQLCLLGEMINTWNLFNGHDANHFH